MGKLFGFNRPSHREQTSPSPACTEIASPEFTCRSLRLSSPTELFASLFLSLQHYFSQEISSSEADCGLQSTGLIEMSCGAAPMPEVTGNHAICDS